jgi:hypothetical protein
MLPDLSKNVKRYKDRKLEHGKWQPSCCRLSRSSMAKDGCVAGNIHNRVELQMTIVLKVYLG